MSAPESAGQEVLGNENTFEIGGVQQTVTPLQYHYLSLLERLAALKNTYQTDPDYEASMMDAIKKSIYSTFRDCIESNVGDAAREILGAEHQVN
jgi:hypothetical protein